MKIIMKLKVILIQMNFLIY